MRLRIAVTGGLIRISGTLDAPYSTVVFLDDEKYGFIVIDPGSPVVLGRLEDELAKMNKKPEDVDHVLLTHFHMDHAFNSVFFKNAIVHLHSAYSTKDYSKFGSLNGMYYEMVMRSWRKVETFEDGEILFGSIEIHSSPWHAREHVSMILNLREGRYFIVGDVCPTRLDYYDVMRGKRKDDVAKFVREFASISDVVIFPHDEPLETRGGRLK